MMEEINFLEIFNSLPWIICVIDPETFNIVACNKQFLEKENLNKNQISGKKCYEVTYRSSVPCSSPEDQCPLLEALTTGKSSQAQHVHKDESGNEFMVEITVIPIKSEDEKIKQVIHIARDITAQWIMSKKLIDSERRATLGITASSIGHELNNKISGCLMHLEWLLRSKVDKELLEDIMVLKNAIRELKEFGDDLLEIGKPVSYAMEYTPLERWLRTKIKDFKRQGILKGLKLSIDMTTDNSIVYISKKLMEQLLRNIVLNAVFAMEKSKNKRINVGTFYKEGNKIVFYLEDFGCGVDEDKKNKIFDIFYTTRGNRAAPALGWRLSNQ